MGGLAFTLDVILLLFLCFSLPVPTLHLTPKRLPSPPGKPFRIALFADLHFGEDAWTDWGPRQDLNSLRVMSSVLDRELPDFVVYLGDVVTANNVIVANASSYWDMALSPSRSRGIPFSSVFGNHDDAAFQWPLEWFSSPGIPPIRCPASDTSDSLVEEGCSFKGTGRLQLMKAETVRNQLSYSSGGPRELWPSISNYILELCKSDHPQSSIAYLYFLDSGGGSYPEILSKAQVEWFRSKSREINPDLSVPELIFWHIPSKAYEKVAPVPGSRVSKPCVGSINIEKVAPQEAEEGFMDLLGNRSSVKAIFVGHNHGLDWCCPYNKLWLCYARHTGYGGYGDWPRGARIVEINQKPFSIKSWVRMEDGDVHSEVVLSS
ncbi:hypothetical protein MLD38_031012 [Melastoma candidum]|uniref:Uncharacterized protein n=1 Tax=Melastoma candidum TaxID=119954 RepID=A0ACB9MN19_9MYRT|nr:hypothetical protein MLD38_031012 [Melastoma candidum]